jgi:predicted transposase/invertase (TIGR01784 family)
MELTTSWHEQGRMEGEAAGIIKGEAKNKLEIARNMLAKGFSNDLIMELTGLTSDEIAKLKPTN